MKSYFSIISARTFSPSFQETVRKAYRTNHQFFQTHSASFRVIVCHTEKEYMIQAREYYSPHAIGTVRRDRSLVVRSFELSKKKWSYLTEKQYANVLVHEMNHVFWYSIFKTWQPIWLVEGLADWISGIHHSRKPALKEKASLEKVKLDYRYLINRLNKDTAIKYAAWGNFIDFLARKNGKENLWSFIHKLGKTKTSYENAFQKFFGKKSDHLFTEFVKK